MRLAAKDIPSMADFGGAEEDVHPGETQKECDDEPYYPEEEHVADEEYMDEPRVMQGRGIQVSGGLLYPCFLCGE